MSGLVGVAGRPPTQGEGRDGRLVPTGAELGRAHRWLDAGLGILAVVPLVGLAAIGFLPRPPPALILRTLAVIWAACLLAFLAGVRRGLSFSQAGGASLGQIAVFLGVFFLAAASLLTCSPAVAAAGLALVGALDVVSARRDEAPGYFAVLRPLQMACGAVALALLQWRAG